MRASVVVVVVAAVLSLPGRVLAEDDGRVEARTRFRSGQRHYALLEYKEALEEFRAAYRAYAEPAILFNIAQCYRQLGERQRAVEFLRSYKREAPDAANVGEVDRLIGELTRAATEAHVVGPMAPARPPTPFAAEAKTRATATPAVADAKPRGGGSPRLAAAETRSRASATPTTTTTAVASREPTAAAPKQPSPEPTRSLPEPTQPAAPMPDRQPAPPSTAAHAVDLRVPSLPPPPRRWYLSPTGWMLASVGVLSVAFGGVYLNAALAQRDLALHQSNARFFDAYHNQSVENQKVAWPLLGIGIASVAVSGVFFGLAARRHR